MKQKIRTFVAVEIDPAVREMAVELVDELASTGADVKWVEPESMHLTVKFLGEIDNREVYEVCRAVEKAVAPIEPFQLEICGAGAFPNVRRPRNLWLGTGQGGETFGLLAANVEKELQRIGYPREGRRFHAHLTLGRIRQGGLDLSKLSEALAEHADFEAGRSVVTEAVVFASKLGRGGPVYEALGRAALGGGA